MLNKLKLIFKLKYLKFKRSFNKILQALGTIMGVILGLFMCLNFLFIAYMSDLILQDLFSDYNLQRVLFQITPLIIFGIFIFRLLIKRSIEETAINLLKLGNDLKSTILSHISFNIINFFSFMIFIFFLLVGIKNFPIANEKIIFTIYILELLSTIIIFEQAILIFKQISTSKGNLIYLLITGLIIFLLWLFINIYGFPFDISHLSILIFLILICIPLSYLSYNIFQKYILIGEENRGTIIHQYSFQNRNSLYALFNKFIVRDNFQVIIIIPIIYIGAFLAFHNLQFLQNNILYGFFYSNIYFTFYQMQFSPDYKWIGYLHANNIAIEEYINSKLNVIQFLFLSIIVFHLIICFVFNFKWVKDQLSLMIFWLGTAPYIYSWLGIKFFRPKDASNKNSNVTNVQNNSGKYFIFNISVSMMPIIYLLLYGLIGSYYISDFNSYVKNNVFEIFLPLAIIGIIGFLFHNFWIKKLTKYYKKKRFEIFEKSESV